LTVGALPLRNDACRMEGRRHYLITPLFKYVFSAVCGVVLKVQSKT
jgi:hypothetical protein